jgi:hypothetical protein
VEAGVGLEVQLSLLVQTAVLEVVVMVGSQLAMLVALHLRQVKVMLAAAVLLLP